MPAPVEKKKLGGVIAAQEFEIELTVKEMKITVNTITRIRQIHEMVKINLLPLLRPGIDRARGEAIVKSLAFAEREAKTEELKESMKYQFLKKQLSIQQKNLVDLKRRNA